MAEVPLPGGLPPGAKPINPVPNSQAGGVRGTPPKGAPTKPGEIAPTPQPTTPTTPTQAPTPRPSVARQYTVQDLRSFILNNLQMNPSTELTNLASLMLQRGLELSQTNLTSVLNMLQGTNKSKPMQEASVLLMMKGIDSPQAAKVLGQYFADNPGLAAQFIGLQEGMGSLISALGSGKGLLDATLVSQLTGLLSQFDESFQKLAKKASGEKSISREELLNNVRALKSLLKGVRAKAPKGAKAQAKLLISSIAKFQKKLDNVMQNLLSQAILSKKGRSNVNYLYHQIPNSMTNPPKDFEIVVKRDGEGKNSQVDPRNTQVVMSLETETMGKLVVSMIVKNKKVYLVFVFSEKDYANEGREKIAKEYSEFVKNLADKDYMVTGYQVKKDPAMCNIKTHLIPMLPKLEDSLKRIDLEA